MESRQLRRYQKLVSGWKGGVRGEDAGRMRDKCRGAILEKC